MAPGPDEKETGGNPEEGPVLSPDELDISKDERVREIDQGRYVVSSGDPIANSGDSAGRIGPSEESRRQIEREADAAAARAQQRQGQPPQAAQPTADDLDVRTVHEWLEKDLNSATSKYGFDVTATFNGTAAQQRIVSNDVVAVFENLVTWYAQQVDRNMPVEQVLGILLMEANVPIRYPPKAIKRAIRDADLSPDDTISDLLAAVDGDDGMRF